MKKFKWSVIKKSIFTVLGATALAVQPALASPVEDQEQRKELLDIYSYAAMCADAYRYIETDGHRNMDLDLESKPDLLFWLRLTSNAAKALKFPIYDMGMIQGFSTTTKKNILGHDNMMADMRLIAADCAKEKPDYQFAPKP